MKANDRYNPNSFNALHAGVAFLAFWAMNLGLSFLLRRSKKTASASKTSTRRCVCNSF